MRDWHRGWDKPDGLPTPLVSQMEGADCPDKQPTADPRALVRSVVQGRAGSEREQQPSLSVYPCQVCVFVPLTAGDPPGSMAPPMLFAPCALPSLFSTIIITLCIKRLK